MGVGNQFRSIIQDLCDKAADCIVHDHAIWLPSNHAVAGFCSRNGLKRIVSPRGMLGSWAMAHGGWKKRLAWALYQRADLLSASGFHATSDQEAEEIRKLGFTHQSSSFRTGSMFLKLFHNDAAQKNSFCSCRGSIPKRA